MAKQRQVFVNARLGQLNEAHGQLSLVNPGQHSHDKPVSARPSLSNDSTKNEEIVYRLVTSEESDVAKD